MTEHNTSPILWFPNFCRLPIVFGVVLIAQLVATITVVAQRSAIDNLWEHLSLVSLFVQWVALLCTGSLCALRSLLTRLPIVVGLTVAWLVVMLITGVGTVAANWTGANLALGSTNSTPIDKLLVTNLAIAGLVAAGALRYFYVQQQWRASVEAQAESRIRALQARIRPHFLYNSMNTVASLIRSKPQLAERAVEDLADLFRQMLSQRKSKVTLAEELQIARRYLAIEELRMGSRLTVDWQVETLPTNTFVPSLIVQPLIENAIYHGIHPIADGGTLTVHGETDQKHWQLTISNPLSTEAEAEQQGHGMAQDNIRERLDYYYGGTSEFLVEANARSYCVKIIAPLEHGKSEQGNR